MAGQRIRSVNMDQSEDTGRIVRLAKCTHEAHQLES
ncbi:hypothetical protein F441_14004 [Phytophthora nicotianae CJ01A1]|uniref:Uncharacterized protein n=4 Tax=Phytophthora nicotianae TaxID=4792 RepID=W2YWY6_PHYNI|nr:hypothetical protein L917_13426 [Phytophthora nicotianae]ETO69260.1 hypothetical protein F444_14106 [Phytophthora nicotianae P1976]ETP10356.1 hypothetical protein F441_14004 [Phytophthora nicotianae CJ01A1]ETP38479.1 hypothetical protein F442_13921 [Phytophthora nicotianae P10297]